MTTPLSNKSLADKIKQVLPTLEGWCLEDKALAMAEQIVQHKPAVCVEIGVFGGSSLIPQALALQANGSGKIYGIDPYDSGASIENMADPAGLQWWQTVDYEKVYNECVAAYRNLGLEPYVEIIRRKSEDAVSMFSSIDCLHIDGNHSSDVACRDVAAYVPLVKSGGIIWFDDSNWRALRKALALLSGYAKFQCVVGSADRQASLFIKL